MLVTELYTGPRYNLYAMVINNSCIVQAYIDSLEEKQLAQLFSLFNRILEHGPPTNDRKFKNLGDNIYELKTYSGVRILCFFGGSFLRNTLILTHGFDKGGDKQLRREKEKAIAWLEDYSENAEIVEI